MAITLVDVVVFLPMAMAGGLIGNILREFSLVVVFSTLMSLFVAFTLTPLLASRWGKLEHLTKDTLWGRISLAFESGVSGLQAQYGAHPCSGRCAQALDPHRCAGAVRQFRWPWCLRASWVPPSSQGDRGEFIVQVETAPQSNLATTDQLTMQAERIILQHPEVVNAFTNVGTQSAQMGSGSGSGSSTANLSEINVKLIPKHERTHSAESSGK
jgi:HAE1 family hydrophobic/amphiphilic exporter-1